MIHPHTTAFLLIDMQLGFIDPASTLCVAGAASSVETCACALEAARKQGMYVVHVRRTYAIDGHDVEPVRRALWEKGGKPLSAAQPNSLKAPASLEALPSETVLIKPSFSAFFKTDLHHMLERKDISTVVLAGTTTPNCVRSTCYDALSYGYNVAIISDATSSRTQRVQEANLADMAYLGVTVIDAATFSSTGTASITDYRL